MRLLRRGAEADIYGTRWMGLPAVLKARRPKRYRDPGLDARLRRRRTSMEARMMARAKSLGVPAPLIYHVDPDRSSITMQRLPGRPVHGLGGRRITAAAPSMGRLVGMLHRGGIVHGDPATSNFLMSGDGLALVDFGLSRPAERREDRAVDLRLIREALGSAHAGVADRAWAGFSAGYARAVGARERRLVEGIVRQIEARGRYAQVV
ncbi:MAG: Kae1-associated serine/threonine protein kinase [Nitrosopumilus sp.]